MMQGSRTGVALKDIEERFGVGRRTAQRMKEAVLRVFPQADDVEGDDRRRRWSIPPGLLNTLMVLSPEELAAIDAVAQLAEREGMADHAYALRGLGEKLKGLMKPDVARRVEPDYEALAEAEGIAMRPGPRPMVRPQAFQDLRDAIKGCRKVRIAYRKRGAAAVETRTLRPHGFLFGHRHYLVALDDGAADGRMRMFSLPGIESVETLAEGFVREADFSIRAFAGRGFGVYNDDPVDVVWRFSPAVADTAREFQFHPSQSLEPCPDGSLIVRFRAAGLVEMGWHAVMWGRDLEILEPQALRDLVASRDWSVTP